MDQDQPIDPNRWVDDHGDALFAFALLRLREAEAATEVVQETFVEALRGRSRFEGRSSERTWLIGILKHKIIDEFRRRSRRESGTTQDRNPEPEVRDYFDRRGEWKAIGHWRELPDQVIERTEFWEVFRACLALLPETHAEAFTLSEIDGMSGPEICKLLEITPTNLWARLHRARLLLRQLLNERWFDREPPSG